MQDTFIFLISCVIEGIISYYFFDHILKGKLSFSKKVSVYIVLYVLHCFIAFMHLLYVNVLSFLVIHVLIAILCYECRISLALFYSMFLTIFMSLTEAISLNVISKSIAQYNDWSSNAFIVVATFFISKLLYWICVAYIVHFIRRDKKKASLKVNLLIVACMIFTGIISVSLLYICFSFSFNIYSEIVIIICFTAIIIVNILIFWLQEFVQKQQESFFSLILEREQERMTDSYNELIVKQDENQKVLIHDIKNHMITLNEMCNDSSDDDMREYIRNLLDLPGLCNRVEYTQNKSMNIILNRYEAYCKKYNISFTLDVSRADISFIEDADITALFCNALDNACEAAINTSSPFVDLKISPVKENAIVVSLENSCERRPVKNSLGRFVSSKGPSEDHGLGTLSIQRVAKRYNGNVDYHYDEDTNVFHTIVLLCKGEASK